MNKMNVRVTELNNEYEYDYLVKLVVVGDSGVGKSSLLLRFADNYFSDSYVSTIGVDFKIKTININGKIVKVQLWDTAGQERFRTIVSSYYRGADGVMYVYDVTNDKSLHHVRDFNDDVKKYTSIDLPKLLVGNKIDCQNRLVSFADAENLAKIMGMGYIETSAKTGAAVDDAYIDIVQRIIETKTTHDTGKHGQPKVNHAQSKLPFRIGQSDVVHEHNKCCN